MDFFSLAIRSSFYNLRILLRFMEIDFLDTCMNDLLRTENSVGTRFASFFWRCRVCEEYWNLSLTPGRVETDISLGESSDI